MTHLTSRLGLPYILESQSQKEITHNEALEIIDVLLHASVIALEENTPPESPIRGDCYITGHSPQDAWENNPNTFAYYTNGWNFITPFEGLTVWIRRDACHYTYNGSKWLKSFLLTSNEHIHLPSTAL